MGGLKNYCFSNSYKPGVENISFKKGNIYIDISFLKVYYCEMKEIFKRIIAEFHNEDIPEPIPRDIDLPQLPKNVRKAFIYIGMRRSGKTWSLYQRMHELMKQGISKHQILYINFEDDRLNLIDTNDLQTILEAYWELYPQNTESKTLHFFFDEIAEIDGWESFVRRLLDKESMQIYLSGSSAKMLSKEIASSLRGRTICREIFPLSLSEYLNFLNFPNKKTLTTKQKAQLIDHLKNYLDHGGFPETLETNQLLRHEIIRSYMNSVIYRDIIERHNIKNHTALKQLLLYCLQNPASLLSTNKLFKQFKSRGINVSKDSLYQFSTYFEDAYCLFPTSVYSFSLNKTELKPKKIYPIDTGLITTYSIKPGYNEAALLETAVFLHLRRQQQEIHYYQTAKNKEIDFITIKPSEEIALYQASLSIKAEETKREIEALLEAMQELKLTQANIITLDENTTLTINKLTIHVTPLWQFLQKYE